MTIQFRDAGRFIQVINSVTGTNAFVSKRGIVIRQDNSTNFFIKNDSYIDYFAFGDVLAPIAIDCAELVRLLVAMAQSDEEVPSIMENVKVSDNVLELSTPYNKNSFEIDEMLKFGGNTLHNFQDNSVSMNITTSTNSRVVRQSKEYISIPTGKTVIALINGSLINDTSISMVESRLGMFDNANDATNTSVVNGYGMYFKYDSETYDVSGISLVLRNTDSGPTITEMEVYQADWNLDSANGVGLSTVFLDPSSINTYVFCFGNSYGMNLSAGVIYNGKAVIVHEFTLPATYNYATRVPVRWEIKSTTGSPASAVATMTQKSASVYASTKQTVEHHYFASYSSNEKNIGGVGQSEPILSLRLADNCIRGKLRPKTLHVLNTSAGGIGRWELYMNANLTGESFSSVNGYSFAEVSTSENNYSGGTLISSGYIVDVSEKEIDLEDTNKLLATIKGDADTLTLVVTRVKGSLTVLATIEWQEFE